MTVDPWRQHADRVLRAYALEDGDADALARCLSRSRSRAIATGETVCREGDPSDEIYFLLEGRVRVAKRDHEGHERDIGIWFAPAIMGGLEALGAAAAGRVARTATCTAAAPCTAAVLDAAVGRAIVGEASPDGAELRWLLLSSFTEILANTTDRLKEALATPAGADLVPIQAALAGLGRPGDPPG
jgi:CRP-like cAMP-binding protein